MPFIFPVYDLGRTTDGSIILPDAGPVYEYTPPPESGAQHWLLGGSAASLTPIAGSATLTPQGTLETYGENYVEVPSYGNALLTNIPDQSIQTHMAVVQYQPHAGKNTLLLGNLSNGVNGWGNWLSETGQIATILRGNTPAFSNHGVPTGGAAAGDYIFIAAVLWEESGVTHYRTIIGAQVFEGQWTGARSVVPVRSAALGNAWYGPGATIYDDTPVRYAEYIAYPGVAKTAAEISTIYARSKQRMVSRGINLI